MKVLLRRNVAKLGLIGEVVDVKPGYARNYLIPQRLAVAPTEGNLKAIEAEKEAYLAQVAQERAAMVARAEAIAGKEVTLSARANEEGHLYGSVGPVQIAAALAAEGVFIEAEQIVLDEPIRRLDKYDLAVRFQEDVTATIHVWIVPIREETDDDGEQAQAPPDPDAVDGSVEDADSADQVPAEEAS